MAVQRKLPRHKCAAEGCERRVPTDMLMCPEHWRLVSPMTKSNVYRAYDAYLAAARRDVVNAQPAADELRRAQQVAVREVGEQLAVNHDVRSA